MYTRSKEYVKSNKVSPELFIDDTVQNSELLYKIDRITEYKKYTITRYEHRADLIAKDIYGSADYSWLVMYINRISIDGLVRGVVLNYIDKPTLDNLISQV